MEQLEQIKSFLAVPKDIVITAHRNPDGDAIGSSLALYHYLIQHGHTCHIIFPSEYPAVYAWMPDIEKVTIYDIDPERSDELIGRCDLLFCLDFNSLDRIDKLGELVSKHSPPICMIDHHLYPDEFAQYELSDPTASSTCELIYRFIQLMGDDQLINNTVAEAIYTGILTDTGSFKYATSPRLFRIVAELMEKGIDNVKLQDLIFNSLDTKQLQLLGYCLNKRMEILEEYGTGIITLSRKDYEQFDIQRGDTEGIVNFLLKLKKVNIAAFITEQPTIVKISLRSKGDVSVQEMAQKYFKGGGHKNAAGGSSYKGLRATVLRFKQILPEFVSETESSK